MCLVATRFELLPQTSCQKFHLNALLDTGMRNLPQEKGYAAEKQRLMYFGGELEDGRDMWRCVRDVLDSDG